MSRYSPMCGDLFQRRLFVSSSTVFKEWSLALLPVGLPLSSNESPGVLLFSAAQYLTEEGTYSLDQGEESTGGRGEGGGRTSTGGLSTESSPLSPTGLAGVMREAPDEVDRRSVYVGNVSTSPISCSPCPHE